MTQYQQTPWKWHSKDERSERIGSIYSMKHPGHAYAVAMQPRYVENKQWSADAAFIAKACNAHEDLVAAATRALNYIEDSESELGIQLGCGNDLRKALALTSADRATVGGEK